MPKYLSGRVKRTPQDKLTEDRYLYLGLDQTEPNLGDPPEIDTIPPGDQFQIVSVRNYPGERYWKPIGGGTIPAAHTVRDEGVVVPKNALFPGGNPNPNAGINSITDVNFVGLAVTVAGFVDQDGFPGTAVTVTVSAPGNNHELLFNNDGEFATSSFFTFDNTVGIESVGIGTNLRVQGDLKLDKTIYGENNQPGNQGDLLVKTATGGMIWQNQNAVRSGAGGTIYDIQFHNTAGLVDGASTNGGKFVYRSDTSRVGIGSTIPEKLLDVLGYSRFDGDVEFVTSNQKNIFFDQSDDSLIFGDTVKAKFGDDLDASIHHDNTNFHIDNDGGNTDLRFGNNNIGFKTALLAVPNNRVELFFNDIKKFETTNTGIAITGTDHSIHGEVGIQSHVKLNENAELQFGVNPSLRIFRDTSDGDSRIRENGTGNLSIEASDIIFKNSSLSSPKTYAKFNDGDSVDLYFNNDHKFQTTGVGVSVIGLTSTTDLSVTGFVTSHLIPGTTELTLGTESKPWKKVYVDTIIGVDNEEFEFLKVTGILTAKNLIVEENFKVGGISTFIGIATFGSGINVTSGITTVGSGMTVSGISTFNDTVVVGSGMTVSGISTFNNDVIVGTGATVGIGSTVFFINDAPAVFGDDEVLEIYYGQSPYNQTTTDKHSYIRDKGDLDLVILSNQVSIRSADETKDMARFYENDRVELRYDNNLVFQTTGYGVSITGITSTTNLYVTGISTFSDHIETTDDQFYDIGSANVGFRTVYAKEFVGKKIRLEEDLDIRNLKVNGISTFIGIATFGSGINVTSGITTVGFLTAKGIFVSGVTTATDFNSLSDRNYKTNIQVIDNPIDKIMKIDGVSFNWKASNKPSFGVIADNVQKTLPDLVSNEDPKTVNYNGLVGLLIEVVKNQQEQINELRGLLDK
tara:strand:- start:1658 stop:4393 length:2736 start_codon:yes stop_codon:yes gene_type:complete